MEHRWGYRMTCDIGVKLFADPASVGWGRIRDVSISGAFIETKLRASPPATVRLTRVASTAEGPRAQTLRAVVVRRDRDGIGVEWFDADADAVHNLVQEARAELLPSSASPALPSHLER